MTLAIHEAVALARSIHANPHAPWTGLDATKLSRFVLDVFAPDAPALDDPPRLVIANAQIAMGVSMVRDGLAKRSETP